MIGEMLDVDEAIDEARGIIRAQDREFIYL